MLQKKVKKRASLLATLLLVTILAIFFILQTLNKNILYFKSPTDIKDDQDIHFKKKNQSWRNGKEKLSRN